MTKANANTSDPMKTPATGNNARVLRYRAMHRRIDYAPSSDALAIIELWLGAKLDNCRAGVIDRLVQAGHKAIAGNVQEARP